MFPAIVTDIAELRSKNALLKLTCDCHVLISDYVPRAVFSARYHESHELAAVTHATCRIGHRCGQTQGDGQHRGLCGPTGPQKPVAPAVSPTPDSPPAIVQKPVRKPAQPVPTPVQDDGLDASWAGLLDGATPALARR